MGLGLPGMYVYSPDFGTGSDVVVRFRKNCSYCGFESRRDHELGEKELLSRESVFVDRGPHVASVRGTDLRALADFQRLEEETVNGGLKSTRGKH